MSEPLADDIVAPDAVRDPHTFFRRLRERDPIHWSPRHRAWIVTRYEDVEAGFVDDRLSTDNITPLEERMTAEERERFAPVAKLLHSWMIFNDPPVHTHLRAPVRAAFKPKAIEGLRAQLTEVVDGLLDRMEERGTCDLIKELAFPFPATAIAILLGVAPEDRERFREWSRMLGALVIGKVQRPDVWERAEAAEREFSQFFTDLVRQYEEHPGDNLTTELIRARDAGDMLTPDQMVGALTLLLFGGHETTTNLIASGTLALLRHPEQRERLRASPDLLPSAIEEIVRFDGPSKNVVRRVKIDHDREGRSFEKGQAVFLSVAGANHDPEQFPDPDRFDIERDPNRHLGFGWGLHFCLGAQLARLEGQVAIARIIERFPKIRLASEELRWSPTILGRALRELPVSLD